MATRKQQEPGSEQGEADGQPARDEGGQAQGERQGRAQSQRGEELDFDSLREHGRALREAAGGFREATQQALADAESLARSGVQERPYTLLGVAFATGWVLGGGVPVRIASLATGAVGRAALGLAAARLAEMQTNGSGGSARRRESARDRGPESGARAEI
jgi:hypothetical protein